MTTVIAQGTFDILHPGHVHYLEEAASMGDELFVIVARPSNVDHKSDPVLPGSQRRSMVDSLDPVDEAVLGHREDVFVPIDRIEPDIVVLGHDQFHDEAELERALRDHGHDCEVTRASEFDPEDDEMVLSSSSIVERIIDRRQERIPARMRPPSIRNQYP